MFSPFHSRLLLRFWVKITSEIDIIWRPFVCLENSGYLSPSCCAFMVVLSEHRHGHSSPRI
ncbi:hypothetical protein DAI22_12g028500 [Oryza sativa Japonica Group]|nr:hypothetical protein DAI22_12g028500 [Oryza sativa Japonica Group]KAF2906574.1 hypothetical protein DAI22_12g028500 [Oryza sativa Japonica Group]KAF2906575.1 hypothetical protein DAI22_12g028500 [Oryza sativa Japonica Group]KAF2906576.1 hypothetical protein DAI22_12g028500 [Oryza sativa Japonica Group]KAF2906577.1 hypothetical protein DAI22_12g028500 [Oryza sativa Japonica Group]